MIEQTVSLTDETGTLRDWDTIQREIIERVYVISGGNIVRASDQMGEHRRTMQRRFHRLGRRGQGRALAQ